MIQINTRIKQIRKDAKLTQEQFGARIGITGASCSTIESGKSNPSTQTIKSICREFNIREEWLRTGEGVMHIAQAKDEEISRFLHDVLKDEPETFRKRLIAAMATWSEKDWEDLTRLAESLAEKQ